MKNVSLKKLIAGTCSAVIMLTSVNLTVFSAGNEEFTSFIDDFESAETGSLPAEYIANYTDGNISVENYNGDNVLSVEKSGDGQLSIVTRNFPALTDTGVEVSFDFMQNSVKIDGTTVFALCNSGEELVKLETYNGNISFKNSLGGYTTVVENYLANKWYNFTVDVDLLNGEVSIAVGGTNILRRVPFTSAGNACDSVSFSTKYSPGFYINNLSVRSTSVVNNVVIYGDDKVTIPVSGENTYEYTVSIYDDYGAADENAVVDWELESDIAGVSIEKDGNKCFLTIADWADNNGVIVLTAYSVDDPSVRASFNILVVDSTISTIKIKGEAKLAYGLNEDNKFEYTYEMYDQYGVLQENEDVIFKIKENTTDVTVDQNGVVTLNNVIAKEKHVTLVVTYADDKNVQTEKILTLMDLDTYKDDEARMDILCDAMDNVLEYARDQWRGTPLLTSNINLHTGKSVVYQLIKQDTYERTSTSIMANLAQDSALFRAFDAATILTGNEKYTKSVDEIYKWYLESETGINEFNLGNWGGHTWIDIRTGQPEYAEGNPETHEFKSTAFYLEPFFRLDEERGYSLVKTMWGGHIGEDARWTDLIANRHAQFDRGTGQGEKIAQYTLNWDNLGIFDDANTAWIRDNYNQPFRDAGNDLATIAAIAYKETGDETAKIWAYRIINQYYKRRNPDTGIIPSVYTTGRGAKGVLNPEDQDPEWYKKTTQSGDSITSVKYGDRFFNQFALDLVDQGYYPESALDPNDTRLLEGNYFNGSSNFEGDVINDLQVAKTLGLDTEEAQSIRTYQTINVASYLKYAWIKGTNKVRPIMADGTSLMGFKPKRNGYYGQYYTAGGQMGGTTIGEGLFPSVAACYEIARSDKQFAEQEQIYWEYLQFFAPYYGLGKLGEYEIGDEGMALNYATTASSPQLLMAVVDLYYATGNTEFLTLARRIAENMISTYYKYGIFVNNSNTGTSPGQYYVVFTGSTNSIKYYSLCYLEAAIRGESDLIPHYYPFDGYVQSFIERQDTGVLERTFNSQLTFKDLYNPVEATDLIIDEVIYLKPGETKKLEYKLLPDDVTSTSIVCESEDKSIVRVNKDDTSLIGVKPGTANLIVCSNEFNIIKNVKVIVSEEGSNEKNN